jgi:hypothetical protein
VRALAVAAQPLAPASDDAYGIALACLYQGIADIIRGDMAFRRLV